MDFVFRTELNMLTGFIYIYVCIYRGRERGRETEKEAGRQGGSIKCDSIHKYVNRIGTGRD